ncbi:MAG: glucose-6-phosphate isomerase [Deltaproteobacteria bacterium]|nr:glucose-6-phosphate isomerase [Deltaproteobacteria bacterium]MBW1930165.1 glucose-6-phosphate isomerase [Deltaproteobacteria bacterium]MBW2024907.1 glucose-6-phosphate isomerase [Deltaproteobacteria bacterium]MBW2124937.1 glucose-6-phosphate isomerase [Deltaproteobacteria bacterium]
MAGLKLTGIGKNGTVVAQQRRGFGERNPFRSESFRNANQITLDLTYLFDAPGNNSITRKELDSLIPNVMEAHRNLKENKGDIFDKGIAMTGWQDLPVRITQEHLQRITDTAHTLAARIDAYVSLGIGGSYLGIEATFRALSHHCFNQLDRDKRGGVPEVYFLGQNMDPDYFRDTLDMLEGKKVGLNVISKSGTTTETAIAFRIMRRLLEENWGEETKELIIVTTDKSKGALRKLAEQKGYTTFVVPDDIGGRFSVLSDVGLVGLAVAGIDIEEFVEGFRAMRSRCVQDEFWENPCLVHAAARYLAWMKGKKIEVVATNSSALYGVARWMEQLFPESEGHEGHGMWVSPSLYSEKLHANGQMVQEGERNILETFLFLQAHDSHMEIPWDEEDLDGLNFLPNNGLDMGHVNRKIIEGPAYAHYKGGVPCIIVEVPHRNAYVLGQLYYMMERSVAISGYLMGHNPFTQPGVEAYKRAMFALLGKPGFEQLQKEMGQEMEKRERIKI